MSATNLLEYFLVECFLVANSFSNRHVLKIISDNLKELAPADAWCLV